METPRRTVRVPDDVWKRATERATENGTTVSERIVEWLDRFGRGEPDACVCCGGTISDDGTCGDCGCDPAWYGAATRV